jgi:hypothetical protein
MADPDETPARPSGCTWGCLLAIACGIALIGFGWDVFAKLCFFLAFASALVQALRERVYRLQFSRWSLRAAAHPMAFWSAVAINAVLALLFLWSLVAAARAAVG